MLRDITIGKYYPSGSVVHSLDPRTKLGGTLLFIISLFIANEWQCYLAAAAFLYFCIRLSKVPLRYIVKGLKAVLFLLVFSVIFLFVGDQSVIHFIRRGREIKRLEEQRDRYQEGAEKALREIQVLQNPDSLESFAREHYFMHLPGEDIYLVEE